MTTLSRCFGTEEVFADIDIANSHEVAGFLAVYCPQEEEGTYLNHSGLSQCNSTFQVAFGVSGLESPPGPRANTQRRTSPYRTLRAVVEG